MRLDERLVKDLSVPDLIRAGALIMSGMVYVNGQKVDKAGFEVKEHDQVILKESDRYVGRGALKLKAAFSEFQLRLNGDVCADLGSSTGGFTEVLLEFGAGKVYAIDVGYGELDWKLRKDSRVVVLERTNARYLENLPEKVSFITADLSFISLKLVIPNFKNWLQSPAEVILLVKPQFEARIEEVEEGGIVRNVEVQARVVDEIKKVAENQGFHCNGIIPSPVLGSKGNQEFLGWFSYR